MPYKLITRTCPNCGLPFTNRYPKLPYCSRKCSTEGRAVPPAVCSVEGCGVVVQALGFCDKHYYRFRTHGDPHHITPRSAHKRRPVEDRFWSKVDKSGGPDACWPWLAAQKGNGYGQFTMGRNKSTTAHRIAYILSIGPIPEGLEIDHVKTRGCTRRDCCNPAHLEPVTHHENVMRSESFSAIYAQQTHCKNGHALTEDNVYLWRGTRYCRTCRRERNNGTRVGVEE